MYVIYFLVLATAVVLSFATKRQPLRLIARIAASLMFGLLTIVTILVASIFRVQ